MTDPALGSGEQPPAPEETVLPVARDGLVAVSAGEEIVVAPGSEAAVAAAAARAGGEVHYWFPSRWCWPAVGRRPTTTWWTPSATRCTRR